MYILLAFTIALLLVVFLSGLAKRSPVSGSVLFLVAGLLVGPGVLNLFQPADALVTNFTRIALVTVLFTDGMNLKKKDITSAWSLAGRALFFGLPITLFLIALLSVYIVGLSWNEALLVAAVLSPTDPVFASQLVSMPVVPLRLRGLLNIESGLNDGLVLPIVLTILATMNRKQFTPLHWVGELVLGIAIGVALAWLVMQIMRIPIVRVSDEFHSLLGLGIGMLIFATSSLLGGNDFLAAFSGGITVALISPKCAELYMTLGESFSELLKLGALLILGALLSIHFFDHITWRDLILAILVLILARPVGLSLALIGSKLDGMEKIFAAWFGPRGFASVFYGLLVYRAGTPRAIPLFQLIALIVVVSIFLHSSTDFLAARWYKEEADEKKQKKNKDENEKTLERNVEPQPEEVHHRQSG